MKKEKLKGRLNINEAGLDYQKTESPEAFEIIYEFTKRVSRSYCYRWKKGIPEDILSSSIEKIITKIYQFDINKGEFYQWVYQIVKNELRLYIRSQKFINKNIEFEDTSTNTGANFKSIKNNIDTRTDVEYVYQPEVDGENIHNIIIRLYEKVIDIIYNLPDDGKLGIEKKCLIKWHIEKKKYRTIGEELNIPENTAKYYVRRGKKTLKEILEKKEPELSIHFRENINNDEV